MSHPLRIALVLHRLAHRPVGRRHAKHLARELLGRGHVVHAFGVAPDSIPHAASEAEHRPLEPLRIREFRPDVLIAYDARSPAALRASYWARRLDVAMAVVEDGHGLRDTPLERGLRGVGRLVWGTWVRRSVQQAIALDPVAQGELLRDGYDSERVHVVAPGVDLTQFRPGLASHLVSDYSLRGRLLAYIGSLDFGVGLGNLIESFAATVGQRSDWSLVLAGSGPAEQSLRAHASRRGIASQVRIIASPRAEELPGLLGAATLLAAPSDFDIRIVRRAMACGVPVLAADRPRLRHLVEADGAGLLAESDGVEGWTEMLRRATQAPERRRRWSQRARLIAEERFSWSMLAEEIEAILCAAVEQRGGAAQGQAHTQPSSLP